MAKLIPGKEEFYETLRYFSRKIEVTGVDVRLRNRVDAKDLLAADPPFDAVVLATGVLPRKISFEGSDHPKVLDAVGVEGVEGVEGGGMLSSEKKNKKTKISRKNGS